jgi:hypothetical protein
MNVFGDFDFGNLDDPQFLEDSVREEFVSPLLKALGYSASPPHKIIRSLHLRHPFVYIGTVKKHVTIIPDYLLQRDAMNAWILDAKAPNEPIDSGKNVEQAYSYAIHPDVRVPIYALCNGRRLIAFHISRWEPLLDVKLTELDDNWPNVLELLGTRAAWPGGIRPGYSPDFGLAVLKSGLARNEKGEKYFQIFDSVPFRHIARLEDNLYTMNAKYVQEVEEGQFYATMMTFDFDATVYQKLLAALPDQFRERVNVALTRQPYKLYLENTQVPLLLVGAEPGDVVYTNDNESYCPFLADRFTFAGISGDPGAA